MPCIRVDSESCFVRLMKRISAYYLRAQLMLFCCDWNQLNCSHIISIFINVRIDKRERIMYLSKQMKLSEFIGCLLMQNGEL